MIGQDHWLYPRYAEFMDWLQSEGIDLGAPGNAETTGDPSDPSLCYLTVGCRLPIGTPDDGACLKVVCKFLEVMAHGYKTVIKTAPWTSCVMDQEKAHMVYAAYVRFLVYQEEGQWTVEGKEP